MKTNNKKKVVVSVLALAMGAGLAGSISGSVAWYQYSTRTTAQLQGVSAGTTRNLQVRLAADATHAQPGAWKTDITKADIETFLGIVPNGGDSDAKPEELVLNPSTINTTGNASNGALDVANFKGHPVYQYGVLPSVGQTSGTGEDLKFNYVQIPLEFQLLDDGVLNAKDIYLTAANFVNLATGTNADITPALRLHISNGTSSYLIANTIESTNVSGALDLNANDKSDREGFSDEDTVGNIINYGNNTASTSTEPAGDAILKQASYAKATVLAGDADAYTFTNKTYPLGTTVAAAQEQTYLKLTLTIWLEGWTELDVPGAATSTTSNLWDLKYSGSDFGLQLRFACEAEH